MTRIRFDLTIGLESAFHVQAGYGASGLHQSLVRNHEGAPVIPASSIKGRLRYNAVRFGHMLSKDGKALDTWAQTALRHLFGDENRAGALFIGNANLAAEIRTEKPGLRYREIRSSNMVDRRIGSVAESHLRFFEVLPTALGFTSSIEALLPKRHDPESADERSAFQNCLAMLLGALRLCDRLGAGKSRGSGRVVMTISQFRLKEGLTESHWDRKQRQRWLEDYLRRRLSNGEVAP